MLCVCRRRLPCACPCKKYSSLSSRSLIHSFNRCLCEGTTTPWMAVGDKRYRYATFLAELMSRQENTGAYALREEVEGAVLADFYSWEVREHFPEVVTFKQ